MLDVSAGTISFQVGGPNSRQLFQNESGTHSFQRVPPNERNGRVHTSEIHISVLAVPEEREITIRPQDVKIEAICGSGNGGQKKNKTSSCIVATHIPTNTRVRVETERSQYQNKMLAMGVLEARIREASTNGNQQAINHQRRQQLGGIKRRSARIQHGVVVDHLTGRRWIWPEYESGQW